MSVKTNERLDKMSNVNLFASDDKSKDHARYVAHANATEGQVIRRHLDNLVATYGADFTSAMILRVLEAEIKHVQKKQREAKRAGKAG